MRPKKKILCVFSSDSDLSIVKFLLTTHGYNVLTAQSALEGIGVFIGTHVDLVLVEYVPLAINGAEVVATLKRINPYVPMIILAAKEFLDSLHSADAMIARANCSPMELLERVKVMSARKRGPRKGVQRAMPLSASAGISDVA